MKKAIGIIGIAAASFSLGVIGAFQVPKQKKIWDVWYDAFNWGYRCRALEKFDTEVAKNYYKEFKEYVNEKMMGS